MSLACRACATVPVDAQLNKIVQLSRSARSAAKMPVVTVVFTLPRFTHCAPAGSAITAINTIAIERCFLKDEIRLMEVFSSGARREACGTKVTVFGGSLSWDEGGQCTHPEVKRKVVARSKGKGVSRHSSMRIRSGPRSSSAEPKATCRTSSPIRARLQSRSAAMTFACTMVSSAQSLSSRVSSDSRAYWQVRWQLTRGSLLMPRRETCRTFSDTFFRGCTHVYTCAELHGSPSVPDARLLPEAVWSGRLARLGDL